MSESKYQPDADDVRNQYALDFDGLSYWSTNMNHAEFDRWLAEVKAEAWDEGAHHGADTNCRFAKDTDDQCPYNPYREVVE